MTKNIIFPTLMLFLCFFCAITHAQDAPVKEMLQGYVDSGDIPGAVTVIATKDKVLQIDCAGYADVETKRPMTPDTVFWMASQTKPVTAVAVMMLVDEGKVSLDEPATKYLPELETLRVSVAKGPNYELLVAPDKPITLRMLLSHTAGTVFVSPMQEKFGIDSLSTPKALISYAMTPLISQPGTKYHYSNVGINIAATVVERVSGVPFEQFLEKRLFEPLGMTETTFWPTEEQMKRLAKAYSHDKETKKLVEIKIHFMTYPFSDRINRFPEGGGGLFSTPNDWVKFYQMLAGKGEFQGKRIVSEKAVEEMSRKQTSDLPEQYGLGVNLVRHGDQVGFGHGGSHGTNSLLNVTTGRIGQYFIQQAGLQKSDEAQGKFMQKALVP